VGIVVDLVAAAEPALERGAIAEVVEGPACPRCRRVIRLHRRIDGQ
jgi:hypothetical protein